MAGVFKPDNVKPEIEYKIWGYVLYDPAENLFNESSTAVYPGPYAGTNTRTNTGIAQWYRKTDYLDIEFYSDVNIYDYGSTPSVGASEYGDPLNVFDNTNGVKGNLTTTLSKHTGVNEWQMIGFVPKGRYRIELTSSSPNYKLSTEWYLESVTYSNIKNQTLSKTNIQEDDNNIELHANIEVYNILRDNEIKPTGNIKENGYEYKINSDNIIKFK